MRIIGLDACSRLLEIQAAIRQKIQRLWLNAAKHRGATALIHISVRSLADDVLVATIAMTQQCAKIGLRATRHEKRRLGMRECDVPGHYASPIVPDNGGFLLTQVTNDGNDITYQQIHVITLDTAWLIAQVVASLVDCHQLELVLQTCHLMPRGIPEVGKTMDHHDQWALADRCIVDSDPFVVRVAVIDLVPDTLGCGNAAYQQGQDRECAKPVFTIHY